MECKHVRSKGGHTVSEPSASRENNYSVSSIPRDGASSAYFVLYGLEIDLDHCSDTVYDREGRCCIVALTMLQLTKWRLIDLIPSPYFRPDSRKYPKQMTSATEQTKLFGNISCDYNPGDARWCCCHQLTKTYPSLTIKTFVRTPLDPYPPYHLANRSVTMSSSSSNKIRAFELQSKYVFRVEWNGEWELIK